MTRKDPRTSRNKDPRPVAVPENDALRLAAQNLVEAIAAEPVPERLRVLAMELNAAMERRRNPAEGDDGPS